MHQNFTKFPKTSIHKVENQNGRKIPQKISNRSPRSPLGLNKKEQLETITKTYPFKEYQTLFSPENISNYNQPIFPYVEFDNSFYVQNWLNMGWPEYEYILPYTQRSNTNGPFMNGYTDRYRNRQRNEERRTYNKSPIQIVVGPPEFLKALNPHLSGGRRSENNKVGKRQKSKFDDSFSSLDNLENWTKSTGLRAGPDVTSLLILNEKKRIKKMRRNCSDVDLYKNLQSLDKLLTALYKRIKFTEDADSKIGSETRTLKRTLKRRKRRRVANSKPKRPKPTEIPTAPLESETAIKELKEKISKFKEDMTKKTKPADVKETNKVVKKS